MSLNKISNSSKVGLIKRTVTGILLMAVVIPCAILGNWPFFILNVLLSLAAIHEILATPGPKRYNWLVKGVVYIFVISFIYWVFLKNMLRDPSLNPFTNGGIFTMTDIFVSISGVILYALVLFLIAIFDSKIQLQDVTYLFTMGIVIALGFMGIFFVRYFPNNTGFIQNPNFADMVVNGSWNSQVVLRNYFHDYYAANNINQSLASCLLLIFICVGTWAGDVGAYLFGMLFGKHRMNPRISPHKTWEGFIGGAIFGSALALGFAALFEFVFKMPLVPGLVQFGHSPALEAMNVMGGRAWPYLVLITLMLPVVGNVGGFTFSLIKRQYGIKDFGKIFPGHGGVIDRFDSILTNSIAVTILIWITAYGWVFSV